MTSQADLLDALTQYLRQRHGLSETAIVSLGTEWNQQGCILKFLVGKGLLARCTAQVLEAVRKGYFISSFADVLGFSPLPLAEQASSLWGHHRAPAALPTALLPPEVQRPRPIVEAARLRSIKPTTGMQLGRFILQEPLGEGGTGTVFRSFHPMLCIPVAIKVFTPIDLSADADITPIDLSADTDASQRFTQEARALARLRHPNIVRVLDVGVHEQFPYIVMEYVGELTLETQIQKLGTLSAERIAKIGTALADALAFIWQQGLLHRDVKPANILERRDGRIKLADFGICAKRTSVGGLSDPGAALGFVSGTPSFIAPEQAMTPHDLDFRADMYGLGATLYHAAVGHPPYAGATAYDIMVAQLNQDPTPISQIDPRFDVTLASTIHRMLRRERQERFGSWAEARAALDVL